MHPLASEVIKGCIPRGQRKPFPANCMSLMTVSGAKGSTVNFSQIACLLGQQVRPNSSLPCPWVPQHNSIGLVHRMLVNSISWWGQPR